MSTSKPAALIMIVVLIHTNVLSTITASEASPEGSGNSTTNLNDLLTRNIQFQQQQVKPTLSQELSRQQMQYSPIDELISEALIEGLADNNNRIHGADKRSGRMFWHPTDDIGPYGLAHDNQEKRIDEALNMILQEISSNLESSTQEPASASSQQTTTSKTKQPIQLTPDGLKLLIATGALQGTNARLRGGRAILGSSGGQKSMPLVSNSIISTSLASRDRGLSNFPKRAPTRFRPCHFNAISCPWGEF